MLDTASPLDKILEALFSATDETSLEEARQEALRISHGARRTAPAQQSRFSGQFLQYAWEDRGSSGEGKKRKWHDPDTGEWRVQIIEPGTRGKGKKQQPMLPFDVPSEDEEKDRAEEVERQKAEQAREGLRKQLEALEKEAVTQEQAEGLFNQLAELSLEELEVLRESLGIKPDEEALRMRSSVLLAHWLMGAQGQRRIANLPPDTEGLIPPMDNFTGADTLGRTWKDGRYQPGKDMSLLKEMLPTVKYSLDVGETLGFDVKPISQRDFDYIWKKFGLKDQLKEQEQILGQAKKFTGKIGSAGDIDPELESLVARGLVRIGMTGTARFTDKGSVAYSVYNYAFGPLIPKPPDSGSEAYVRLYTTLSDEGRQDLLTHMGVNKNARQVPPDDFRNMLEAGIARHYNPVPIAQRIRDARDVQKVVNQIAGLRNREAEEKELDGLMKEYASVAAAQDESAAFMMDIEKAMAGKKSTDPTWEHLRLEWQKIDTKMTERGQRLNEIGKRKREIQDQTGPRQETKKLLASRVKGESLSVKALKYAPEHSDQEKERFEEGAEFLRGILARSPGAEDLKPVDVFSGGENRAFYMRATHSINWKSGYANRTSTAVHELCHAVEHNDLGVHEAIRDFYWHRVRDESAIKLNDVFHGSEYKDNEVARKDRFDLAMGDKHDGYYAGKDYGRWGNGSSEIFTMGVQKLYEDPAGFCRRDPEYATLIIGLLDGSLRSTPAP